MILTSMLAINACQVVDLSSLAPPTPTQTVPISPASSTPSDVPEPTSDVAEATWTPLPTLTTAEAVSRTMELLSNNAGCELPCWWGVTPGDTTWNTARQFLATFAEILGAGESRNVTQNGTSYLLENFDVQYEVAGHVSSGLINYGVVNGVVNVIWILPRGTEVRYKIHQLLAAYGKPEMIWINVDPDTRLFYLLLYYPSRGVTAQYEGPADRGETHYELCLPEVGPELWLWSPEKTFRLNDDEFIGPDFGLGSNEPEKYMRPIESVGLDSETFYETFKSLNPNCIDTPRDLWEAP